MTLARTLAPRDPTRPAEYYEAGLLQLQEAAKAYTQYNNPILFASVAPKYVRMGVTLYSAGAPAADCLRFFDDAAEFQVRFLAEGKQYQLGGKGGIDNYLELYSAAHLAQRSDDLITVLKKCSYAEPDDAVVSRLIDQFCDVLQGRPVQIDDAQIAKLKTLDARVALLPRLFAGISKKDAAGVMALEEYLVKHWGPALEKVAKKELKSAKPEYAGKWCLLAAAMCKRLGKVPQLSIKALSYLPVELVFA
jgi:hypothetical protein